MDRSLSSFESQRSQRSATAQGLSSASAMREDYIQPRSSLRLVPLYGDSDYRPFRNQLPEPYHHYCVIYSHDRSRY